MPDANTIRVLMELVTALGPIGTALAVVLWIILKRPSTPPPAVPREFSAEQKLWFRENAVDPIIEAIRELK